MKRIRTELIKCEWPRVWKTSALRWVIFSHFSRATALSRTINSAKRPTAVPPFTGSPQHLQGEFSWKKLQGLVWLFVLYRVEKGWKKWRYSFQVVAQRDPENQVEILPSHKGNCKVERHAKQSHSQLPPGTWDSRFSPKAYRYQT